MNILEIPFAKTLGMELNSDGALELPFSERIHNHLQTIHASAQFALAETASGAVLLQRFPELEGKLIPVLRDAQIKFRKPAQQNVTAYPSLNEDEVEKFRQQFSAKGRALIPVNVEVKDADGTVTCSATYTWFMQAIEP
ncbi:MAG: DUF4442 domain-containing protein [Gammaproteobacteria bacterium]|nr:DUF4442 domain-containing protein [Gammaproteobacteria bacterium]